MRVAIYSGKTGTTFINNLIKHLAEEGVEVLLFDRCDFSSDFRHRNIRVYRSFDSLFFRFCHIIFYFFLVFTPFLIAFLRELWYIINACVLSFQNTAHKSYSICGEK